MGNLARLKKITGIILTIIFAPIELILLLMVLSSPYLNSGVSPRSMILNLLFPMILLAFPLVFGIRIWLAAKRKLRAVPTLLGNEKISIHSSVSLPEYLWLMWKIVYTNLIWIYVQLILAGVLVIYMVRNESPGIQITILVIFAMSPLTTYVNGKREYKTSTLLHQDALFEFDAQNFTIISGASTFSHPWNSIHKIREIGNFLLVYKEKQAVYIISRANISSRWDIDIICALALKNNVRIV